MQTRTTYRGGHRIAITIRWYLPAWLQMFGYRAADYITSVWLKAIMLPQFYIAAYVDLMTLSSRRLPSKDKAPVEVRA